MRGAICVGILRKRWSWCVVWYLADVCWCWRGQDVLEEANEAAWDTMLSTAVVVCLGVPECQELPIVWPLSVWQGMKTCMTQISVGV